MEPVFINQSLHWLPADTETPISLYIKTIGQNYGILLESAEVDGRWGRYSILASDFCFFASCKNGNLQMQILDKRFESLKNLNGSPFVDGLRSVMSLIRINPPETKISLPPLSRALFGYLGFGMVSVFNPHLASKIPLEEADCLLALPSRILIFDHLYNRLCQLDLNMAEEQRLENSEEPDKGFSVDWKDFQSSPSEAGYKEFVRNIRNQLHEGAAIQVVPSVCFSVPFKGNPFGVYRRLRQHNASPYLFYMNFPHITLFGSSPEVMVRCTENSLLVAPIAGTRQRGASDEEDQKLAEELLADPKDRAEHVMLVDLGRNDLGKVASPGTVKLEKYMEVEKFSHVMHLTSKVSARLNDRNEAGLTPDALDILASTFPAGTVSGAPKVRAIEIIRDLEQRGRGPYAGCIGWIGLDRATVNLDMGITLRSMWVKDDRIFWQAGGGIVHDSDPDLEWNEVMNKSAIMRQVLSGDVSYVPSNR